jgi:hypothetical protein
VLLRLAYLGVTNVFALLRLLPVSSRDKDAEILALRHQLLVLQRQLGPDRVRLAPADRALLNGASDLAKPSEEILHEEFTKRRYLWLTGGTRWPGVRVGRSADYLSMAQFDLLSWVLGGCKDGVYEGTSYRVSARALHNRGLIQVEGRGPTCTAKITSEGKCLLKEQARRVEAERERGRRAEEADAVAELGWSAPAKVQASYAGRGEPGPDLSIRLPSREILVTVRTGRARAPGPCLHHPG